MKVSMDDEYHSNLFMSLFHIGSVQLEKDWDPNLLFLLLFFPKNNILFYLKQKTKKKEKNKQNQKGDGMNQ